MKKIPVLGYVLLVSLLLEAVLGVLVANKIRLDKANEFLIASKEVTNQKDSLVFLLKSIVLYPSEEKKNDLIRIYYETKEPQKAEFWIKRINSNEKHLMLAQHYLATGELEKYKGVKEKLTESQQSELDLCSKFLGGDYEKVKLLIGDVPLSALLVEINKRDYERAGEGYLEIHLANSKGNKVIDTELTYAENLISINQTRLARFILERVIKEEENLTLAFKLMAESYEQEGNYEKALESTISLINADPSSEEVYINGIKYAEMSGKDEEVNRLKSILKRLVAIKNNVSRETLFNKMAL